MAAMEGDDGDGEGTEKRSREVRGCRLILCVEVLLVVVVGGGGGCPHLDAKDRLIHRIG